MPTQFCNLPYISIIYWKLRMSCLKMFSYILQVFVCSVCCCTVSKFYHAHDISIIYCSGGGFLFVYLSCWIVTYAFNWSNICRVWTNNGNTRQYRNIIVLAALKEHYSFVCLCCIVPVSVHYRLYLVTVQRGQAVGAHLARAYVIKTAAFLGVSRKAISRVMTTYTNHGRISST